MKLKALLPWLTFSLFAMCMVVVGYATLVYQPENLAARIIPTNSDFSKVPWKLLSAAEVSSGATIPADTNVVFIVPLNLGAPKEIFREVLLGHKGKDVRYWGYCFPENYQLADAKQVFGFPGKIFLSEAERDFRKTRSASQQTTYSILRPPTRGDIRRTSEIQNGTIRHQIEAFQPGTTCYIMTAQPLPIGIDVDDDELNTELERFYHTDPFSPDTDSDGVSDGTEIFIGHTNVLVRDSDGDGLIDGIEDLNQDGVSDSGETDPNDPDTDRDGLCDGLCRLDQEGKICTSLSHKSGCVDLNGARWAGEDKNLNGLVDAGETSPTKWSSTDNGISDLQKYYNCLLSGGKNC